MIITTFAIIVTVIIVIIIVIVVVVITVHIVRFINLDIPIAAIKDLEFTF